MEGLSSPLEGIGVKGCSRGCTSLTCEMSCLPPPPELLHLPKRDVWRAEMHYEGRVRVRETHAA